MHNMIPVKNPAVSLFEALVAITAARFNIKVTMYTKRRKKKFELITAPHYEIYASENDDKIDTLHNHIL